MKTPWKMFMNALLECRSFCLCFVLLLAGIEMRTLGVSLQLLSARNPQAPFSAGGNGNSVTPVLSADGRFVLFSSSANDLVPGDNNQLGLDLFLRDRWSNSTVLVSTNFAGFGGGNGNSVNGVISTNGQFVVFQSDASDLLPGDTNGASDIIVRNLQTGTTELISVAADGGWGNSSSTDPVITPDGRYVAFISVASNLVAGDSNVVADVFLRDRNAGTTTLVSVGARLSSASASTGVLIGTPVITPDGRYVAYSSNATNLVAGQTSTIGDVFLRDVTGGTTTWVSSNAAALVHSNFPAVLNPPSSHPVLSSDGRFVTFKCGGTSGGPGFIFQYDATSSNTTVIATNAFGAWTYNDDLYGPEVTADGRFIAYCAVITNTSTGPHSVVHLWDTLSATDTLISQDMNGNAVTNAFARAPVVSADGRYVAFLSNGTNFVANTISNGYHAYIRDTIGGTTQLVDADTNGAGSIDINGSTLSMNANGQFVAFGSPDGSLVTGDNNRSLDVFVRDVVNGTNELVSKRDATIVPSTGNGVTSISQLAVSSDGRWNSFTSQASDLVTNDFNGDSDVFLADTIGGTNALVSVGLDGKTGSGGYSAWPAISADGRYVAFQSAASNLVVNDNNGASDIYLRDMQSGTTALVSLSIDGVHSGNGDSFSPSISQDGRYLAFLSTATDLNGTATGGAIWHDMQSGTNVTLPGSVTTALAPSMSADGRYVAYSTSTINLKVWDSVNSSNIASISVSAPATITSMGLSPTGTRLLYNLSSFPTTNATIVVDLVSNTTLFSRVTGAQLIGPAQWSADANLVAFTSVTNLVAGDNNRTNDVYLFNVTNSTLQLISVNQTGTASGNGPSDSPALSGDGRFVVYRSFATDVVPGVTSAPNITMYDRQAGSYSLLSLQQPVSSWVSWVAKPAVNTNGTTVAFQSWTPGLISQDLNNADDAFAFEQQVSLPIPTNPPPVFEVEIAPAPGAATNGNQLLTWPAIEGLSYQIQFTTNLSDPQWIIPTGNVWVAGGQAYFTVTPTQPAGFYRILLLP